MTIEQEKIDLLESLGVTIHEIQENDPVLAEHGVLYNSEFDTHYVLMDGKVVYFGNYSGVEANVFGYFA